jgi:hypothetical protein
MTSTTRLITLGAIAIITLMNMDILTMVVIMVTTLTMDTTITDLGLIIHQDITTIITTAEDTRTTPAD